MNQGGFASTSVAKATPFDNSTNGFIANDVQSAIEEVRSAISTPSTDQLVYVSKGGNDVTGNGSFGNPYLTIGQALTSITDSSPTKRYVIQVGPGDYPENLILKANIFIKGSGPIATRITGSTININDVSWNITTADDRSGFQDISINNTATWDFTAQANDTQGKLYFWNIRTGSTWAVTADNAINQLIIQDSQMFGTTTFNGMTVYASGTTWQSGNIVLNSSSLAGVPATFTGVGCNIIGNISATWTSNATVTLNLSTVTMSSTSTLTASGTSCVVNASEGSLPILANRTFSSGAILNRIGDYIATGLLSTTTNVDTSASTAPAVGETLVATSTSTATWQDSTAALLNNGDGSDGTITISSGITTMSRDMYYDTLTISSTGELVTNGWKIYAKTLITISGTGSIINNGTNGVAASAGTVGAGGIGGIGSSLGAGQSGTTGGAFGSNTNGSPGGNNASDIGYGGNGGTGGAGGNSGSNLATGGAGGTSATYLYIPERVVRHDPLVGAVMKAGGEGGTGGGGGASSLLNTAGAGGGGGGGGGVVQIFCKEFNNTSSVGVTAKGGNGGAGGTAAGGNSGGGGGGAGGGGGYIHIVCQILTSLGTLNVAGGTGGAAGGRAGTGFVGVAGGAGSTGHTAAVVTRTNTWTVT